MHKVSLPVMLQLALQQHAAAADINDDEELKGIMSQLSELHEKVEMVKHAALLKRAQSS